MQYSPRAAKNKMLHSGRPFVISARRTAMPPHGCGCSSGVEHNLAKVGVEGSNPFARSNNSLKSLRLRPSPGGRSRGPTQNATRTDAGIAGKIGKRVHATFSAPPRRLRAFLAAGRPSNRIRAANGGQTGGSWQKTTHCPTLGNVVMPMRRELPEASRAASLASGSMSAMRIARRASSRSMPSFRAAARIPPSRPLLPLSLVRCGATCARPCPVVSLKVLADLP